MRLLLVLFFLGHPFWETKSPERWSDREIEAIRNDSPWAQSVGPEPKMLVYLATAAPIEEAEEEARLRAKYPLAEPDPDYLDYRRENGDKCFVLALPGVTRAALDQPGEEKTLEERTEMIVGRNTYKIVGHFPPTEADPVLRLVFPRAAEAAGKSLMFHLYFPGVSFPDREVEFRVKDLRYRGKLEM